MYRWFRKLLTGTPTADMSIDLSALGVAECKDCHRCLQHRFVLRLMVHLEQDHSFTDLQAHDVSVYMMERFVQQLKQENRDETKPESGRVSSGSAKHGGVL